MKQGTQWIQTRNGAQFWIDAPHHGSISPPEIATVLSRVPRFGGHTIEPYNVLDHSIRVAEIVPVELRLAALLHDAHEAYSGFGDVCRPAKQLAPIITEIEMGIDLAVARAFGIEPRSMYHPDVKWADDVLLATEHRDLMGPSPAAWPSLPEPLAGKIIPRTSSESRETWRIIFQEQVTRQLDICFPLQKLRKRRRDKQD